MTYCIGMIIESKWFIYNYNINDKEAYYTIFNPTCIYLLVNSNARKHINTNISKLNNVEQTTF